MNRVLHFRRPGPAPRRSTIPPDVLRLVDIDAALSEVEELAALAAGRLENVRFKTPAWSEELENWVCLVAERTDLRRMRARVFEGGLRVVRDA